MIGQELLDCHLARLVQSEHQQGGKEYNSGSRGRGSGVFRLGPRFDNSCLLLATQRPASCSRLQSMQRVACGRASNLLGSIGRPQFAQIP